MSDIDNEKNLYIQLVTGKKIIDSVKGMTDPELFIMYLALGKVSQAILDAKKGKKDTVTLSVDVSLAPLIIN